MNRRFLVVALALAPAWAQIRPVASAAPAPAAAPGSLKTLPPGSGLGALEKDFDDNLQATGLPDHVILRGFTRGLRIDDYGAVFTAEVDLVVTPTLNMFQHTISADQAREVHRRKLGNLPELRKTMRNMMTTSASTLTALAPEGHIVVAVRLEYQSWEDRTGLPSQIVMKASRQSALAGDIQTQEE